MLRKALVALMLVGCTTTTQPPENDFNYRMPLPLAACTAQPLVLILDNKPYVGYTYEDSLIKAACEERTISYIQNLHDILCIYRKDCDKENDDRED